MAIAITGPQHVDGSKYYIFTLTGVNTTKLDTGKENERLQFPPYWDTENVYDGKVGDWREKESSETEEAYTARTQDPFKFTVTKVQSIYRQTEDQQRTYTVRATAVATGETAYSSAKVDAAWIYAWTDPKVDYWMKAGIPFSADPAKNPVYVIHDNDNPQIHTINTPFNTTFPTDEGYQHDIKYVGDSSFFWDHGQIVDHPSLTVNNGVVTEDMRVVDWSVHADYTGYTTVSATCTVTNRNDSEEVIYAQDGYLIFMEYHDGTLIRAGYLKDGRSDKFLVNDKCEKLKVSP